MRKPFYLYGALCVTAIGMLALALPAQAENVKKKHIAQPKYEDFTTSKQGQSGSTTTKPTTQQKWQPTEVKHSKASGK